MFSTELARKLIAMPKQFEGGITAVNLVGEKTRILLRSETEPEFVFLLEITSNKKVTYKISLHFQENNVKEGLMRIDYKGGHKNPETVTEHVPPIFRPYAGHWFHNVPHIHFFVEGYRNLAWAAPLSDYNFPVLDINNTADFSNALISFAKEINITTPFTIQTALL